MYIYEQEITDPRSILQIALEVHMTAVGSYARQNSKQIEDINILRKKLKEWRDSNISFDNACKDVIKAALMECLLEHINDGWNF